MRRDNVTNPPQKRMLEVVSGDLAPACPVFDDSVERATIGRTHYDRAKVCASQGDMTGAISAYETAIVYAPEFAEAHSNLGNLYLQSGRCDDALRAYETALHAKPDLAPLYCNLAALQIDLGRYDEAIATLETAIRLAPDLYAAHANLCQAYRRSGRDREALAPALRATALRPDRDAFLDIGEAAFHLEASELALDAYRRALALDATCAKTHCNLGVVYHAIGRHAEAIAAGEAAIVLCPDFAVAHCNLGAVYQLSGRYTEAIAACEAAIALQPDLAAGHCNLGAAHHSIGGYPEAIGALQAAVALRPDFPLAHFNLALSLLVCGDFARGWDEYVWLWRVPEYRAKYRHLDHLPLWNGEEFADRRLLITGDEGFGDAIQFVRYLPAVKAHGGHVILEVKDPLVALFADAPGVDELRVQSNGANDVDLQIPLSGLPRAFAADLGSMSAAIPYLRARPERIERWHHRLETPARLRVGIVWAGNPDYADDRRRSARFDDFAVLGEIEGIAWFGLQKGRDEERRSCGSFAFDPLGAQIRDFADTAAIITQLDLVIGVDTAVVHLAGALGTPVWTLLPFAADWRWLLKRDDSPWYPTMRLFRQPSAGDWASVFAEVAWALRTYERHAGTQHQDVSVAQPHPAALPCAVLDESLERKTIGRTHYDRAKVCALKGDASGAILAYETAVTYVPEFAEALSNLGNLYLQSGRRDDALGAYQMAIRAKPDLAPLYCNFAAALIDIGRYDEAIAELQTALRLAPNIFEAHMNLCQAYRRSGRDREALATAIRATELRPDRDAFVELGAAAFHLGGFDAALEAYQRALALDATCAEAHCNLGAVHHMAGRHDQAIAAGEAAIALRPDFALAHCNLAAVYHLTGRYADAIVACETAIALQPDFALAHCNLGVTYQSTCRYTEAMTAFAAAIALQPDFPLAHFNLAISLLIRGDFVRGWDEYIWLWRVPDNRAQYRYLDRVSLWNGAAFAGRQLLITADEGFGDAIQLVRYLPAVKARGGRVILKVKAPLVALFTDFSGVDELRVQLASADSADNVDLQIPLSGLPRFFATELSSLPETTPYLRASPERIERWRRRLETPARLRVGIVWAGNPNHANDHRRSVRLEDFAVLGDIKGIAWFGLQKGRDEERQSCGSLILDPLGADIGDFADTAAILAQLDLVIGVDTAIVHLAGALGTPVYTLLSFAADWRWLLERNDSPWYTTMRLFRQPSVGDWASVFAEVAHALHAFEPHSRMRNEGILLAPDGVTLAPTAPQSDEGGHTCAVIDEAACERAAIGSAHYDRAKAYASQGDISGAISAYEMAIADVPEFAEAHSNLGNLYLQSGRRDDALRAFQTAIRAKPDLAPLYCNLAAVEIDLGHCDDAIAALETALRLAPDLFEIHANLCCAYRRSGREWDALAPAMRAAELRPDRDAFMELGATAFHLDAFDVALDAYRRALALDATCAEAQSSLGWLYHLTGHQAEAIGACEDAIASRPDFAAAHDNLGVIYQSIGQSAEAIAAGEAAIALQPDFASAHCNLGVAYHSAGRYAEAIAACEAAIALQPDFAAAHCNLGAVYLSAARYAEAIEAGEAAIVLQSDSATAHDNLGVIYHAAGRYAEAIAACEAAIALQSDFASAHFNLGCSLLVRADFARGWDEYVWSWRVPSAPARYPYLDRVPLWNGEAFTGRQLLITFDQGFGDAIQMARYLPLVKARGGRVVLEVRAPLVPLFADVLGMDELRVHTGSADIADDVDLHIPLSGLPRAFGTDLSSIPASVSYLRAQPECIERWRLRLEAPTRLRVGIIWAGNPGYSNDRRRSGRLEDFSVLGNIEGIAWFGLQKGRDEKRRSCGSLTLDPLGAEIGDFADTAAIIAQLDLVIGVDTSVVHLAGALGKPVWTLLPFAADWRWLLARDDSPWYPTMRLFRQPAIGDWVSVFSEVARELGIFKQTFLTLAGKESDARASAHIA